VTEVEAKKAAEFMWIKLR